MTANGAVGRVGVISFAIVVAVQATDRCSLLAAIRADLPPEFTGHFRTFLDIAIRASGVSVSCKGLRSVVSVFFR